MIIGKFVTYAYEKVLNLYSFMQRCYELLPFPAQIFVTFLLEKVTNKDKTCCNFFEFGFVFLVLKWNRIHEIQYKQ